jgi:hypothetical protein
MIADWKPLFDAVKAKSYSSTLHAFLLDEYQHYTIYPPRDMVYQAFKLTAPKELESRDHRPRSLSQPRPSDGDVLFGTSRH